MFDAPFGQWPLLGRDVEQYRGSGLHIVSDSLLFFPGRELSGCDCRPSESAQCTDATRRHVRRIERLARGKGESVSRRISCSGRGEGCAGAAAAVRLTVTAVPRPVHSCRNDIHRGRHRDRNVPLLEQWVFETFTASPEFTRNSAAHRQANT